MELSYLIAKIIAGVYLFAGLGLLLNQDYYMKTVKEMLKSSIFKMQMGLTITVLGVLWVAYHNVWEGEWWVILITIFGWMGLLKGFIYMVFPESLQSFAGLYKKQYLPLWSVLMLVIGAVFGYYGFIA